MEINNHNIYLYKALDAYPYDLEATMEALNYALSYDDRDAQALFLMGKVYMYELYDLKGAVHYYEAAMLQDMEMPQLYPEYLYALIYQESYTGAQRLLEYAQKIKGTDKAELQLIQGQLFECLGKYKKAIKTLKSAQKMGRNNRFNSFIKSEIGRLKEKLPKKDKNKKCKKKKSKKNKK